MILVNKNLEKDIINKGSLKKRIVFYNENSLKKIIKYANKNKIDKIYYTTEENEELIVKVKNRWVPISKYHINLLFINEKKLSLGSNINFPIVERQKKTGKNDVNYSFREDKFIYKECKVTEKIELLLDETIYIKYDKFSKFSFSKNATRVEERNLISFKKKLFDLKANIPGVPRTSAIEEGELIKIKTQSADSVLGYFDGVLHILTITDQGDFAKSNQYTNSFNNNIVNNANGVTTNPPSITRKNILAAIVGIIIVSFLVYFTFNNIFSVHGLSKAFAILGNEVTWKHIWIYILIVNFIVTFFYTFFIAIVLSLFTSSKMNWKKRWQIFLSTQLRQVVLFTTGNFVMATAIWAIYMNSKVDIRVSSLIGTLSVMGILRSIFQLGMAVLFLVPGTIYLEPMITNEWMEVMIFVLGWGGLIWSCLHNVITSSVIFIPFLQILYVKIKTNFLLSKRNSTEVLTKVNSEVFFTSLAFNGLFKERNRIYWMFLMTFGMTMFEAIETVMTFQIVEDYYDIYLGAPLLGQTATYWNIFGIAGVRLMSTYVHMFPLLNIIPGQGVGITDLFMSNVNILVTAKQHSIDPFLINDNYDEIAEFSSSVTIITRFLNFYLKKLLAIIFALSIILTLIYRKFTSKEHNFKRIYN